MSCLLLQVFEQEWSGYSEGTFCREREVRSQGLSVLSHLGNLSVLGRLLTLEVCISKRHEFVLLGKIIEAQS